jgi:hypothetical protein
MAEPLLVNPDDGLDAVVVPIAAAPQQLAPHDLGQLI